MSITKRKNDGKWLLNITLGGRTGKQIKRVFKTQGEARQFEIWYRGQHQRTPEWTPERKDSRHLSELIELWHQHHGIGLRAGPDTYTRLKSMCEVLGNPIASNLTADDFAQYRTNRLAAGVTPNTLNREHAYLRAVFNELTRLGHWSKSNPLKSIRQFKIQETELSYLTTEQIQSLLKALKASRNPHVALIALVCLSTGARWGEAEDLKITQVRNGVIQFANATKSLKARAVPINSGLEADLHKHHKKHGAGQTVFESAYSAFREAIERAQIQLPKGQLSHVLRHTFASHFMMNGGNILALQRTLGHSDLKMTMRYAHLAPDHLEEVKRLNPLASMGSRKRR